MERNSVSLWIAFDRMALLWPRMKRGESQITVVEGSKSKKEYYKDKSNGLEWNEFWFKLLCWSLKRNNIKSSRNLINFPNPSLLLPPCLAVKRDGRICNVKNHTQVIFENFNSLSFNLTFKKILIQQNIFFRCLLCFTST